MRPTTLALLLLLAGCGPAATKPDAVTPPPAAGGETPATIPTESTPPPAPPAEPLAGELGGEPFAPTVTHSGAKLVFAAPERTLTITLPRPDWSGKVASEEPAGPGVPQVEVSHQPAQKPPETYLYTNGYTLALELDPERDGTRAGRIDLTLLDDTKSHLSGRFVAARPPRGITERPTAADAPFIEGKITATGSAAVGVTAIAALADGLAFERVTGPDKKAEATQVLAAAVEDTPPRKALYVRTPDGDRYEFTHLPPGRYLVAARVLPDGPAAWRYVDLAPGGRLDVPLALDAKRMGRVAVKLPTGAAGSVKLIPADPKSGGRAIPDVALGAAVAYEAAVQDARAAFDQVATGKYRVIAGGRVGEVTVEAGKLAEAELGK